MTCDHGQPIASSGSEYLSCLLTSQFGIALVVPLYVFHYKFSYLLSFCLHSTRYITNFFTPVFESSYSYMI